PVADTVACVGYARGPVLFGVIPLIGAVVGNVWYLVVLAIGLARVHRAGAVRTALAILAGPFIFVLLALGLRQGVLEAFKIPSGAMIPTIEIGDHIFVNKLTYGPVLPGVGRILTVSTPGRGDVVVFRFPENRAQDFIKRIIAGPGDRYEALDGRPILN